MTLFTCQPDRVELSQWMTPQWAAERLVERYFPDLGAHDLVLEPSCGLGAFLQAIPSHVPAVGVEIDPELAALATKRTGREVLVGDFRDMALDIRPTAMIGNPPYKVKIIEGFLRRAAQILPADGRCGLLLPAYAMQTHRTVMRWHERWSMIAEIVPRRLFPRLRLPLLFVQFRLSSNRTMVGFALYQEAVDVQGFSEQAKNMLADARPGMGAWRATVEAALESLGGRASLEQIYRWVEPRRPTRNQWWQEKIRQILQLYCEPVERGWWSLRSAA